MNSIKVSVIIPVYQVEAYIGDCLQSVRTQTLKELEIICINDAGTDGGWEIVKKTAKEDSRIRLAENQENRGLSAVRNKGMALAKGEYVYFLDSDDKIEPDALFTLYALAEKERTDAIVFCAKFLFEEESLKERFGTNPALWKGRYPGIWEGKKLFAEWIRNRDWMPSQPRYFYRRDFLEENSLRFKEGILHEDEIFAFDVLMAAKRMLIREEAWFIRRFRKGSIMTGTVTMKNVEGCIHILSHLSAQREEYRSDPQLFEAVCSYRAKIAEDVRGKFQRAAGPDQDRFRVSEGDPKISVIIPVYNVEPYLEDCLESVLSQDLPEIEILCVNDGSTDGSDGILKKYAAMDPRILILEQEKNQGQAAARNRALSCARGEYIYMLDADDWVVPGAFSRLYSLCCTEQPDVIGFENRQFADTQEFERQAEEVLFTYEDVQGLYSGREAFIRVVRSDVISPSVPTYMIKRAFLEQYNLRFTEGILHEDIGFIFEMLLSAEKVLLVHEPYFCRRFRAHSTVTEGFSVRHTEGYLKSWQKAFDCRSTLQERYKEDEELQKACQKWIRDVLGRIRVLYRSAEENLYREAGGNVDEQTAVLYEMLKETTSGRARAEEILGTEACREIEEAGAVCLCGSGQYLQRMIDTVGALDVQIKGILAEPDTFSNKKHVRGFRVYRPSEAENKNILVILAVSHYNADRYRKLLTEAGWTRIMSVTF